LHKEAFSLFNKDGRKNGMKLLRDRERRNCSCVLRDEEVCRNSEEGCGDMEGICRNREKEMW
jgi:hypothetical protein